MPASVEHATRRVDLHLPGHAAEVMERAFQVRETTTTAARAGPPPHGSAADSPSVATNRKTRTRSCPKSIYS